MMVVDASVAIKWFLSFKPEEDHSARALTILEHAAAGRIALRQPPHFVAEIASVLARENPEQAAVNVRDLVNLGFQCVDDLDTYRTAVELGLRLDHHVFDTLYHAVALQTADAILVTADRRYYDKARGEGQIVMLADWAPDARARD